MRDITTENSLVHRVRWPYVALYFALALAISSPFNSGLIFAWFWPWPHLQAMLFPWRAWLFFPAALGPLVAARFCYRFDSATRQRITWLGGDRVASLLVAAIPLVLFTLAGLVSGTRGALQTLVTACFALLYSLGEEAGWRGYLQDALLPLDARARFFLVGLMWWSWHLRLSNAFEWTVFPLIAIASAFVLGHVAEKTRSLLVVASMHSVIMLLTMNGSVSRVFAVAGAGVLLGWILLGQLRPVKPVIA